MQSPNCKIKKGNITTLVSSVVVNLEAQDWQRTLELSQSFSDPLIFQALRAERMLSYIKTIMVLPILNDATDVQLLIRPTFM